MSRRDTEEAIIRPMRRLYLPPRHLRNYDSEDPDALTEAIEQYHQALDHYERDTLEQAWKRVRAGHEYQIWPTPAMIARAAEVCLPRPRPPSETEQKRQRAWDRAAEYANAFMKRRHLAKIARQEGWGGELQAYVQGVAWVQAQLIEGLEKSGVGLPSDLLQTGQFGSTREALAAFREDFASPVATGEIEVRVPKTLTFQWKEAAGQRRQTPPIPK